jgi:crossover junction endodeoxyribonuclease RusA
VNLILPWPPKDLSPNSRKHYQALARIKKAYREACAWTARQQGAGRIDAERLAVHLEFVPPDRRHRDWDNMLAAFKAGADGLADVIGVDDHYWRISFNVADEVGGMVRVRIET